jgi:ribonuclease PH
VDNPELTEALKLELQTIQALIGRSLRAAVSPSKMSRISLTIDACVLCSDAGIAAAAVSGSWVAAYQAMRWAAYNKLIDEDLYVNQIAAVSGGLIDGNWILDLCAEEAQKAEFVVNFVFDEKKQIIEVRAGAEKRGIETSNFCQMLEKAAEQISIIFKEQERAVSELN